MAQDDLVQDDHNDDADLVKEDDEVKEDGSLDGDFTEIAENDPTVTRLDLEEEQSLAQDRVSEPAGLDKTDPGVDDEEDWERKELERGAQADITKGDIDESYGMHVVDADAPLGGDDDEDN
jgi:hypothetical protein